MVCEYLVQILLLQVEVKEDCVEIVYWLELWCILVCLLVVMVDCDYFQDGLIEYFVDLLCFVLVSGVVIVCQGECVCIGVVFDEDGILCLIEWLVNEYFGEVFYIDCLVVIYLDGVVLLFYVCGVLVVQVF